MLSKSSMSSTICWDSSLAASVFSSANFKYARTTSSKDLILTYTKGKKREDVSTHNRQQIF